MAVSYVVSAKKSTCIVQGAVGNFTDGEDLNLIMGLVNRLDIYLVTNEGLRIIAEVPIFGKIVCMKIFRPKGEKSDSIVILTEKHHVAIIGWDAEKKCVVTRAAGNVADRVGRVSDHGTVLTIHSSGLIGIRIYDGTFKIIQWLVGSTDLKCYNVRFEDLHAVDIAFLDSAVDIFHISYIVNDANGRHLKIVELNMIDKELKPFSKQENIENEASTLIPVPSPCGGVIVIGQESILYKADDKTNPAVVPMSSPLLNQTTFTCFCQLDKSGERFLLADDHGRLLMLLLEIVEKMDGGASVCGMRLEFLGETSIAECITYLDNGVVFIGSRMGDSQLIRLETTPISSDGTFVKILETFPNIGPIRDMVSVDCDGQAQLVTCSGAFKEGSLRVIRNGIGIQEKADVDLPDVVGMYPLRFNSAFDNHLLVSNKTESHLLRLDGEEIEDVDLPGFDFKKRTVHGGGLFSPEAAVLLQVTQSEVLLMRQGSETKKWTAPGDSPYISKAVANNRFGQVVVCDRASLYYLKCSYEEASGELSIDLIKQINMPNEIACIDISNRKDDSNSEAEFIFVGLWISISVVGLSLPDLSQFMEVDLPSKILPRSLIATNIEGVFYLLVAMGDGILLYYRIDPTTGTLGEVKKASIGMRPPHLQRVSSGGKNHIFVCSDRPMIIFSSNQKLILSNVNVKVVHAVCSIQSSFYKDCLIYSDGKSMLIGMVDDIQKIHIRTIPLNESPRRIAYQKSSGTYAILSSREEGPFASQRLPASRSALETSFSKAKSHRTDTGMDANQQSQDVHSVLILDQNNFQVLHCHELGQNEHPLSIVSSTLGDDPTTYYVVGIALVYADENEAKTGRIIVFEVDLEDRTKLRKVHERDVKGAPYSMDVMNGKLVAGINSSVRLFEWSFDKELKLECSHFNNISALYVKTKGDQILVGDLMRSIQLLNYKSREGTFEELAKDWRAMWMMGVEFITADHVIGAESSGNLFTCELDKTKPESDGGRYKLVPNGFYYLGEGLNVFRRGSLVPMPSDALLEYDNSLLFGTSEGTVGIIVQFPAKYKEFLEAVQNAIAEVQNNCMRIEHSVYRQFAVNKWNEPASGFIDGDLIESLLDMRKEKALEVCKKLVGKYEGFDDPEDIIKAVEDLARLH
ncbi:unnamed protein product [Caenorhabditis auriculariae]|uniref:DNA damage-binding protein 1 n=1 Tax=Caenorhabditis auriculariae TaxID=2777116 RepID=A0A8S1H6G3_9PELO|nr:unnamed protein product [Caenorhabditis auriculariae]